jgi:hypothetical protein
MCGAACADIRTLIVEVTGDGLILCRQAVAMTSQLLVIQGGLARTACQIAVNTRPETRRERFT